MADQKSQEQLNGEGSYPKIRLTVEVKETAMPDSSITERWLWNSFQMDAQED